MVHQISYSTICHATGSWEKLRRIKNYEQIAGAKLFQRLFTECAEAKVLFGFPITMDPSSEEILLSKRVVTHAAYLIQMIDSVLNMLGPDTEVLAEIMAELNKKHVRMGVTPSMFLAMGKSLIGMIEECLAEYESGFCFTQTIKDAWVETYAVLSSGMLQAYDTK